MFVVYDFCNLFLKGGYDQKMPVIVSRVAPGTPVSYKKSNCLKYLCSFKYVLKTSNFFLAAYEISLCWHYPKKANDLQKGFCGAI